MGVCRPLGVGSLSVDPGGVEQCPAVVAGGGGWAAGGGGHLVKERERCRRGRGIVSGG